MVKIDPAVEGLEAPLRVVCSNGVAESDVWRLCVPEYSLTEP